MSRNPFIRSARITPKHVQRRVAPLGLRDIILSVPPYFSIRELNRTLIAGVIPALAFVLALPIVFCILAVSVFAWFLVFNSSNYLATVVQLVMQHTSQASLVGFFDTTRAEIIRGAEEVVLAFVFTCGFCGWLRRLSTDRQPRGT